MAEDNIRTLVVDDEESFLELIKETLSPLGCEVVTALNSEKALEELETRFFDVVVLDVKMPGMDGLQLLKNLNRERPTLQVIMLTGHGTVPMAVEAMRLGAFDFLMKPVEVEDLMRSINRAVKMSNLERRNIALQSELNRTKGSGFIVGESEAVARMNEFIERAASTDMPVLITGESGTGKELVARAIHEKGQRAKSPLVVVDASTLREELIASELFGHERGAFTGAVTKKVGLFEVADRGSIFLDEIGDISPANQAALLRVIETGTFKPVGSVKDVTTDVRVIAATNKKIKESVAKGEFREDLYYRLNGLTIHVAPLRERDSDIELLARYFLDVVNRSWAAKLSLSNQAIDALNAYHWPGNVRELKYVIERAALLARGKNQIDLTHIQDDVTASAGGLGEKDTLTEDNPPLEILQERYERPYIKRLLAEFDGNKSKVARVLGISPSTLYSKLHRMGFE